MSYHEYQMSKLIAGKDYPFYALIMAAMRQADTGNMAKLRAAWPGVADELQLRYDAPGGLLPDELPEPIARVTVAPEEDDGLPSIPQILAWLRSHPWREGTTGPAGTFWLPPHGQPVGIPHDDQDRDLVRGAVKRIAERAGVPVAEVVREMRETDGC